VAQPGAAEFVFHLSGAGEIVDELGVWQTPAPEEVAFDLAGMEQLSRWEIGLPADPLAAESALSQHEARLRVAARGLHQAQTRLQNFVAAGGSLAGGEAFGLIPGVGLDPQPERDLSAWMQAAQEESFAFPPKLPPGAEAAAREVQAFLEKVRNTTRYLACIETSQDGARQALTIVSWGGDFQSVVKPGTSARSQVKHARAVELAIGTRDAWIQLGFIVLRSAVKLSLLFPTSPVLALPAAYKFIRQVLDQIQAIQDLQTIQS
jgi:hypothetical protein